MTDTMQPDRIGSLESWPAGRQSVRCVRIERETHDLATFVFRTDQPTRFDFRPGQFVTIEPVIETVPLVSGVY